MICVPDTELLEQPVYREMTSDQFREWRQSFNLKQKDAATLLGLKKRMIQYYEKGEREGKDVVIPRSVRLACYALSKGIVDFDGTTELSGDIMDYIVEPKPVKKHAKK
jgi:transcriptional regulator with XRE-family HTH domain